MKDSDVRKLILLASIAMLAACKPAPSTSRRAEPVPTVSGIPAASESAPTTVVKPPTAAGMTKIPAFAGKVWRVKSSSAGEPGSTYAFHPDGTLVIESPHGTPMQGQWSYSDGKLVMTEEGIAYPTEIVKLDAATFQIRSHNPGGAVDITLVPAPDVALPVR
jgi:hypothetical protein